MLLRGREKVFPQEDVEKTLTGLRDVKSARIVADEDGGILEIHAVASAGRSPKQIARDVESMLVAKLGLRIDHRKISIAQVDEGEEAAEEPGPEPDVEFEPEETPSGRYLWPDERRVRFIGVSVAQSQLKAEARVELALNGLDTIASAEGVDAPDSVLRIVSEATLRAVQRFFEGDQVFSVSAVKEVTVGGRPTVVVNICLLADGEEKDLVGACPTNRDTARAAALATLGAVNRFLRRCRPKEPTEYEVGPASDS
ncbi:MAG: hypothetical protein GF400_06230 [Candidatus Eisenbacteria bacterium]|nr:hypothetical protein [Candidatus Eisenbacteria bacterium]